MARKICLLLLLLCMARPGFAQSEAPALPDPRGAFFRSLAFPGWGHRYVNSSEWTRGQFHAGVEVALILSYFGLNIHSNNLEQNWAAYTRSEAGIDIGARSKKMQLAVGDFNSLDAFNDFQLRTRNWDELIEDIPENRWNWESDAARAEYNDLRDRFERIDRQLPALFGFMLVNRVISGISAYNRAKKAHERSSLTTFHLSPGLGFEGISANLRISF